jgi:glycosyltransferase involved in cell wall biosynthesis
MRILLDYRPALQARTGVGEYLHQLARHLSGGRFGDSLTLFTSSWKDRPDPSLQRDCPGARVSDHRIPVRLLNLAWHNLEWPPIEWLGTGDQDVVCSPHPLLTPTRRAAQVVTIHDIDFLHHPERTRAEIRRDYPRLVGDHARRADQVIVSSHHTAAELIQTLGIAKERIRVCPPGAPTWQQPPRTGVPENGYLLFMGTLEPRKNVGLLLAAYGQLLARRPDMPKLVLAGAATLEARPWLDAIARPPLAGHVEHIGYVADADRQRVYSGARALVLPSWNEGFGITALEAMSLGIPVVASDRGALPEVVGDAGLLISPDAEQSLVSALEQLLTNAWLADALSARGRERAKQFDWRSTASLVRAAFEEAAHARAHRN